MSTLEKKTMTITMTDAGDSSMVSIKPSPEQSSNFEIKNARKSTRKSKRDRKARKFYSRESYAPYSKKRKRRRISSDDEEYVPVPPTREEMRAKHVMQLTNVFRDYVSEKLEEADLSLEREKTRVAGLIKSLKNARSLKEKVYVSKTMGYLVSSSDGTLTYNVNPKAVADNLKFVCNCGEKYKDSDRTSCKHCGSVIFHNLDNYFSDYLNKPYQPNVHLQMRNVEKMFNRFDIEQPQKPGKAKEVEKMKTHKEEDFFSFVMQSETPTAKMTFPHRECQSC